MDLVSSVGIANRYGLYGPGIEFQRGKKFSAPVQIGPGLNKPPIKWVPGLHGGKTAEAWR